MITFGDRVVHHGLRTDKTYLGVVILRFSCSGFCHGRGHLSRCGGYISGLRTFSRGGIILRLRLSRPASSATSSKASAPSPSSARSRLCKSCICSGHRSRHCARWEIEAEGELWGVGAWLDSHDHGAESDQNESQTVRR